MSENPKQSKGLGRVAIIGGAVVAISAGGLAVMTHAQDKAVTTPNQPVAYQTLQAQTVAGVDAADETSAQSATAKPAAPFTSRPNFRGDLIQGKPILFRRAMAPAKVQWAAALGQSQKMRSVRKSGGLWSRLPKPDLDRTLVPVILPRDGSFIETAKTKLVSFGDAYALNMPQSKGVQITMYGNRSFVAGDKGDISSRPVMRLAGVAEDIRVGQMEDGWTATFTRYGVVYAIDVTCDDINSDDCKSDTYIRNAITQMDDVTMGADATAEAQADEQASSSSSSDWLGNITKTLSKLSKGG